MNRRTPLLAGNWKMHCTAMQSEALVDGLLPLVAEVEDRDILLAPPFTALAAVSNRLKGSRIALAAQNLYWEDQGAFTGEVSGPMLAAAGCTHVIVGHSERRQLFGDGDDCVARRTAAALRSGLAPIVCVGETLVERESNLTLTVVDRQIRAALNGYKPPEISSVVVAYEPVWAIGTGRVATAEQAQEVHASIRALIHSLFGDRVAARIRILYGGSVKPENIDVLMQQPDLDGALVGGASLNASDFARIVRFAS